MQARALETLVRIHQVQSFSRAAELQNITLSALSMQMKSLETELDAQLFDRAFRPPKLTPLGQEVARQAKRVLDELQQLTTLCGEDKALRGRFRLGVISSVAIRMIPQFISKFAQIYPLAQFDVISGLSEDLIEQVRLGQIDGAMVTRVGQAGGELHFDTLCHEDMIYAAPISRADQSLDDLASTLPFIHFRPTTGIGNLIAEYLRGSESQPTTTIMLDNVEACMEFVKQGLGYTLLPEPDIQRRSDGSVRIIRDTNRQMTRELALVSRKDGMNKRWNGEILSVLKDLEQVAETNGMTGASAFAERSASGG